ncbi:MAG: exosome complex protein Rrp42 [Candidatus Thorarchaeota archaeon]|nr:exosome complex protein Rrp42 [Candidatus Thorarchaeota archaeon]
MGDWSSEVIGTIDHEYIRNLLSKSERIDGRAFDEFRPIEIEVGVVPAKAEGSALVRIGDTSVVAGVKVLVGEPWADNPDEGFVMVTAEMSPIASPLFEMGPPKDDSIELARVVDRGVRESETVDVKKLCIEEGKKVYTIFVDVYPLEYDGNLIDASSIAVNAALATTTFPEYKYEDKKLIKTDNMLKVPLENMAIEITHSKIGEHLVVDPILKEEFVQDTRLTIAVDENDNMSAMQKGGGAGPITLDDLDWCMGVAIDRTHDIMALVKEAAKNIK